MDSPDLTFDQVTTIGRPARLVAPPEEGSTIKGVFREWLFEDGAVWLNHRDAAHTYSARLVALSEVPLSGWHHTLGCDCHYCAAWRRQTSGVAPGYGADS